MSTSTIPVRDGGTGPELSEDTPWRVRPRDVDDHVRMLASRRREGIVEVASAAFADHGYHGVSIRTIARMSGLTHPGLLHHFGSKADLLGAVLDRLEHQAQAVLDDEIAFRRGLTTTVEELLDLYDPGAQRIQLLAMLDCDGMIDDFPGRVRSARLRRVHEFLVERALIRLKEQRLLRADLCTAFAARAFLSFVMGCATRERTVRTMQQEDHADAPRDELRRALHLFLSPGASAR